MDPVREKNVGLMDLDLKDLDSLVFVSLFLLILPLLKLALSTYI